MSFFSKIVENKGAAIAVAGAVAVGALAWLYKSYNDEEGNNGNEEFDNFDLDKQIQEFRKTVDTVNPSLEDIKQILRFAVDVSKKKILAYSRKFKAERRKYNRDTRRQKMGQYMDLIANGMEEVQNLGINQQQEILTTLGIDQSVFIKYQRELGMFMQQLMMNQQTVENAKPMSLQQIKQIINMQIDYIRNNGEQTADLVVEATKNWPPQKKQLVPTLLSIVIADAAFEDRPDIDEEALQSEQMKYQNQLMGELQQLQQVMTPMMTRLSQKLGGGGMGMGGMGGMGGLTPQQVQQLQQLQMQDPAAFQQMMGMMYQG